MAGSSSPIVRLPDGTLVCFLGPQKGQPVCVVERLVGIQGPLFLPKYRVVKIVDKKEEKHLDPFRTPCVPVERGWVTDEAD